MLVRGFGIGFAFMPAMSAAFASLERNELSRRHAAAQRAAARRRLDRDRGAGGRPAARADRRALAVGRSRRGYGTAFWAAAGLTALAIIPCIILMRAERARPPARGARGRRRGRGAGGGDARHEQRPTPARPPAGELGAARCPREQLGQLVQGGDGRGAPPARTRDPAARASSATPSTACCSASPPSRSCPASQLAALADLSPGDRHPDARPPRGRRPRHPGPLRARQAGRARLPDRVRAPGSSAERRARFAAALDGGAGRVQRRASC